MTRLSIGWRLTAWNSLAVAALLVVCGLLVYGMLRRALYGQVDQLLAAQFQELREDRRMATDYHSRIRYWVREFREHLSVFAVVYGARGQVFARTEELASDSVPARPPDSAADPHFRTLKLPIIGLQRTLIGRIAMGDEQFTVVLMAAVADVEANLARVRTVLLSALPISLLLAGALGYWLSRRALAPIELLRARTSQITADSLHQRLPIDNPNDELGRMTQTINDMIARLERSFAEIRRFTADASHELRTPLAVLRTEVEVAMGKLLDEPQQRNLLASVLEECQRLTTLTDQLLTLSRDDAGMTKHARQPVHLTQLVSEAAQTMRPLAEAKQQTLVVADAAAVHILGDASRLRQVFYNLLDNAIKYTPLGGRIEVAVQSNDRLAVVTVTDTGIGIPQEHLPHVFQRFYRVDPARSRAAGGAGLGLSIAKSIVVAHGGRIELTSEVGHGTTCTVRLPQTGP